MGGLLERGFASVGRGVVKYPWVSIILSFIITIFVGSGFFVRLETENRPDQLWVPSTAVALEHKDYVQESWPSGQRFDFWIATCKEADCNMLSAEVTQRLSDINEKILAIEVDGTALQGTEDDYAQVDEDLWQSRYGGNWSFELKSAKLQTKPKCAQFGPFCGKGGILGVFNDDSNVIKSMDDASNLAAINFWETQKNFCPVSIATAGSPCVDTSIFLPSAGTYDCQEYQSEVQRANCRNSTNAYCANMCPTDCFDALSFEDCCFDRGCINVQFFNSVNTGDDDAGPPESAFAFQPFKISTVASSGDTGPAVDYEGNIIASEALLGYYVLSQDVILINGFEVDPVARAWEAEALCVMGIKVPDFEGECPEDDMLAFNPQFTRSLSDEFGTTITADIPLLGASIMGIIAYVAIMMSRRDSVYASVGMAIVVVLIVGLSWLGGMGLGAWIGLKNNNLNNNIPFLLLGLGVDDAFVLAGEFLRAKKLKPQGTPEDWATDAASYGGVSILITSATDALAFLVGSLTVLPALGWFCAFAGMGIVFCFILQITIFLPCLVINERRIKANRFDFLCCFKSKADHDYEKPNGCCGICCKKTSTDILPRIMNKFAKAIVKMPMVVVTLVVFTGLLSMGVLGTARIYKDFKLEWFVPDNSYLQDFYTLNDEYFDNGVPANVYVVDIDYFAAQGNMTELHDYLSFTAYVDQEAGLDNWRNSFIESSAENEELQPKMTNDNSSFGAEEDLYEALWDWYSLGGGVRFRGDIQWVDANCNSQEDWDSCDPNLGLDATRVGFTMEKEYTTGGQDRYDTMTAMRAAVADIFPPVDGVEQSFPYSFEFIYWEEVGVIDKELWRNLGICGGVILGIVAIFIPHIRVAPVVIFCIISAIVEVIGFLHWWGVTISGVSTIYILICVGLAVDYSAHVAHMFVLSTGNAKERAIAALTRIGPSTFNAIASTMVAVVVLSASQSYVFRVFFKALFLVVVLGGANGLWLLPVLLSLVGGSKNVEVKDKATKEISEEEVEDVRVGNKAGTEQ